MFTNPEYGQCIIVENESGNIIGHVGAVKGGGLVWLVNILIDRSYSNSGVVAKLFDAARQMGGLAVAVANEAGSGLLRKKNWIEHLNLQRLVWIHSGMDTAFSEVFFTPLQQPFDLPPAQGYFWRQPFLESILFPWGDTALVARRTGGIRMVTVKQPALCIEWAIENNIRWMDWVGSAHDETIAVISNHGWKEMPSFPWFLDPLDLSRKITLNLFTENPLPSDFHFLRTYADMTRVGMIPQ
jgi:hypothetical protein